jgi:hypothetical protein
LDYYCVLHSRSSIGIYRSFFLIRNRRIIKLLCMSITNRFRFCVNFVTPYYIPPNAQGSAVWPALRTSAQTHFTSPKNIQTKTQTRRPNPLQPMVGRNYFLVMWFLTQPVNSFRSILSAANSKITFSCSLIVDLISFPFITKKVSIAA